MNAVPPAEYCPLCPTRPGGSPTEVPRKSCEIAVFENKFPSFAPDAPELEESGGVLTPIAPGGGVCEVVLYSDEHDATLAGSETGYGAFVVDALLEQIAETLRRAVEGAA